MGRSPRLVTATRAVARPALASIGSDCEKVFSGNHDSSANGLMDGDQLGAVRKGAFHLNLARSFQARLPSHRPTVRILRAQAHQFRDGLAIANFFQQFRRDQRDSFRIIQFQIHALFRLPRDSPAVKTISFSISRGVRCMAAEDITRRLQTAHPSFVSLSDKIVGSIVTNLFHKDRLRIYPPAQIVETLA